VDEQKHALLTSRVADWFSTRGGHVMSVKVRSGNETEYVAVGPFLRLEEHPTSKGVFRALFDDSLNAGSGGDAERYVAFGGELQGVEAEGDRLELDKGAQTIEIVDQGVPPAVPAAEDVTWDTPEVPAAAQDVFREPTPQPPATQATPTAPPPPPPPPPPPAPPSTPPAAVPAAAAPPPAYAPPPPPGAPPSIWAAPVVAPVAAWAPPPVAPPPPPPATAPPAPPGAHGQAFEMQLKAPLWENAMSSKFFGPVTLRIDQGVATVTGRRSTDSGSLYMAGGILMVLGAIAIVFGGVIAGGATSNSDMGAAGCAAAIGLLLAAPGLVLFVVGRNRAMRGEVATVRFRLADASGRKTRYDSNLGCLIALLLTPLGGLIVTLVRGRRIARLNIPAPAGSKTPRLMLVLEAFSSADGAILGRALAGEQVSAPAAPQAPRGPEPPAHDEFWSEHP
jgi:outer membrane biosynthesis protein TonB